MWRASTLKYAIDSPPSDSTSSTRAVMVGRSGRSEGGWTFAARIPMTTGLPAYSRSPGYLRTVSSGSGTSMAPSRIEALPLNGCRRREQVHRRSADEAGHEEVRGPVVESLRLVDLLEDALAHHRDAVAHRHRLDLVVGDVERRGLELLLQLRDVRPHLDAQLGVQVRERLVHEEHLRVAHDRAAHGHALPLPAR